MEGTVTKASFLCLILSLGVMACVGSPFLDSESEGSRHVFLKSGTLDTTTHPNVLHQMRALDVNGHEKRQYLVHVSSPSDLRLLERHVTIRSYIPHNTYLVFENLETLSELSHQHYVLWVGEFLPEYKIAPELLTLMHTCPGHVYECDQEVHLFASLVHDRPEEELSLLIEKWNRFLMQNAIHAEVSHASGDKVSIHCLLKDLEDVHSFVKHFHELHWLEPRPRFQTLNRYARAVVQGGDVMNQENPMYEHGLHGEGEIIGAGDTGIDYGNCFFRDDNTAPGKDHRKIISYNAFGDDRDDYEGHGTHVAGSLAGECISDEGLAEYNGVAYKSKLAFFDVERAGSEYLALPRDLGTHYFQWAYNLGARIHSNSWGSSVHQYESTAKEIDQFMSKNQDFLVVCAVGNSGDEGASSIVAPSTAKNVLTVGATQQQYSSWVDVCCESNDLLQLTQCHCDESWQLEHHPGHFTTDNIADFSSQGPTLDGRLKPDVVAPGQQILSARSDGNPRSRDCAAQRGQKHSALIHMEGSSMAAPVAAGAAVLARQYFREGFYPSGVATRNDSMLPSAALLKAVVINSGQRLRGFVYRHWHTPLTEFPSNKQGYGLVQLSDALPFAPKQFDLWVHDEEEGLENGDAKEFCFDIGSGRPLKITLVWTDPPGDLASTKLLVNNLDVWVVGADGSFAFGNAEINGLRDVSNNVEQILIEEPTAGTYTIHVKGDHVAVGKQRFALVVTAESIVEQQECSLPCPNQCSDHGKCLNQECTCDDGWIGYDCGSEGCPNDCSGRGLCLDGSCQCLGDHFGRDCAYGSCEGTSVIVSKSGSLSSFIGSDSDWKPYANMLNCAWNISLPDPKVDETVDLVIDKFHTEDMFDFLYIYDVLPSGELHLLEKLSGEIQVPYTVSASSPNLVVKFDSDQYQNDVGFHATFHSISCDINCGDHGLCDHGICSCDDGFYGIYCEKRECSLGCENGICGEDGVCTCNEGYAGSSCDQPACPNDCHGQTCTNGVCECPVGTFGASCYSGFCQGDSTLTAWSDELRDHWDGDYSRSATKCSWLIQPETPYDYSYLSLYFQFYDGFNTGAQLKIYDVRRIDPDGNIVKGAPLFNDHIAPPDSIVSQTRAVYLEWETSTDTSSSGFSLVYAAVDCPQPCGHGECVEGTCQCEAGYFGDACDKDRCEGVSHIHALQGTLSDHGSSAYPDWYASRAHCTWIITAPFDGPSKITLTFTSFETEPDLDFVRIYDGEGGRHGRTLLRELSGFLVNIEKTVVSSTGKMVIEFKSDDVLELQGFTAEWTIESGRGEGIEE